MKRGRAFFGTREPLRRGANKRDFGCLLIDSKSGDYGIAYFHARGLLKLETYSSPREVWEVLTNPETPSAWYGIDLKSILFDVVFSCIPLEELLRKIKGAKGELDRVGLVPKGVSDFIEVLIREAKIGADGELKSLLFRSLKALYDKDIEELIVDWELYPQDSGHPKKSFIHQLWCTWYSVNYIQDWIVHNLKVNPGSTIANTAFTALDISMTTSLVPMRREEERFLEPAVFGGAVEMFKMLEPRCWEIDMNGGYGEAMRHPIPYKGSYWKNNLTPEELLACEDLGWAEVDLYIPNKMPDGSPMKRAPLPYRDKQRGTVFCTGFIFSSKEHPIIHFTPELHEAVNFYGVQILKVHKALLYKHSIPFLKDWAEFTSDLKNRAPCRGARHLASRCMQTTWGKFAQKGTYTLPRASRVPKERKKDPKVYWPDPMIPVWYEDVEVKRTTRHLQVAAAITSWARIASSQTAFILEGAGLELIYRDTDSWFINGPPLMHLIGSSLGMYKVKFKDVMFRGFAPKWYVLVKDDKVVKVTSKGMPGLKLTSKDLKDLERGKSVSVSWKKTLSLEEAVVTKYYYREKSDLFKDVIDSLESREETRSFPGMHRSSDLGGLLSLDSKRKHLSLTESIPLTFEEVRGDYKAFEGDKEKITQYLMSREGTP